MATKFKLPEGVAGLTKSGKEYEAEGGVITVTHADHIAAFTAEGYEIVPEPKDEKKGASR